MEGNSTFVDYLLELTPDSMQQVSAKTAGIIVKAFNKIGDKVGNSLILLITNFIDLS